MEIKNMIVKATVNGKNVYTHTWEKGCYWVFSEIHERTGLGAFITFRTIKEAKIFISCHPNF